MEWVALFLGFVESIAWPVVALVAVLAFRRQLAGILDGVTRLAGPGGFELERSLAAATKDVARAAEDVRRDVPPAHARAANDSEPRRYVEYVDGRPMPPAPAGEGRGLGWMFDHNEFAWKPMTPRDSPEYQHFRVYAEDDRGEDGSFDQLREQWHNPYGTLLMAPQQFSWYLDEATKVVEMCARYAATNGLSVVFLRRQKGLEKLRENLWELRMKVVEVPPEAVDAEMAKTVGDAAITGIRKCYEWVEDVVDMTSAA